MTTNTTDRRLVTTVLVLLGALIVLPVFFMGFGMMGYGSTMGGMWGSGMWGSGTVPGWMLAVGVVAQLLLLAVLVGGGYLIYRSLVGSADGTGRAVEELRMAYARGDLTDEEFETRREALERSK